MIKLKHVTVGILLFLSCKNKDADTIVMDNIVEDVINNVAIDTSFSTRLQLNPPDASVYIYRSKNETSYDLKFDDREVKSSNASDVQYRYAVHKDSAGKFIMDILFDSIKVLSQKDNVKSEADAANAMLSVNPLERMLGMLKDQGIQVKLSASGVVESISGYEELGQRFLAKFAEDDTYGKTVAKEQWDKIIANGLVKGHLNQLFKAFPDAPIYQGFSWKLKERVEGELPLEMETTLKIKSVDPNGQIIIVSNADLKSAEDVIVEMPGQKGVTAKLSGYRKGILHVNAKTGMVERSEYISDMNGTILVLGNFVPIKIKNKVKLEGREK